MWPRLSWNASIVLCCAVFLAIISAPGAADTSRNLIIHVEDGDGNPINDAQVVVITQDGEHLKTMQWRNFLSIIPPVLKPG